MDIMSYIWPHRKDFSLSKSDHSRMGIKHVFNARVGLPEHVAYRNSPIAVAYCDTVPHVQSAVKYARRNGYKITVRSGGHSYIGASSASGDAPPTLQIDVSALKHVHRLNHSSNIVKMGPGVTLHTLTSFFILHGFTFTHGMCKYVCAGGHLQSSSLGLTSNIIGPGLDSVIGFKMVCADGMCREYSCSDPDPSVYKAVLGGPPGSWGVIVEYTLLCTPDTAFPFAQSLRWKSPVSGGNVRVFINTVVSALKTQEKMGRCDFNAAMFIGRMDGKMDLLPDIPFLGPLSEYVNLDDQESILTLLILYHGKDSGPMTDQWYQAYLSPLDKIKGTEVDKTNAPLSFLTGMSYSMWHNEKDIRFHFSEICSGMLPDSHMIERVVKEVEERTRMNKGMFGFNLQLIFTGASNTAFAQNRKRNHFPWREIQFIIDDWILFKDDGTDGFLRNIDSGAKRLRTFKRDMEQYKNDTAAFPSATLMGPVTTEPLEDTHVCDMRVTEIRKKYYPNDAEFELLQTIKLSVDPGDLFHSSATIPLPREKKK